MPDYFNYGRMLRRMWPYRLLVMGIRALYLAVLVALPLAVILRQEAPGVSEILGHLVIPLFLISWVSMMVGFFMLFKRKPEFADSRYGWGPVLGRCMFADAVLLEFHLRRDRVPGR